MKYDFGEYSILGSVKIHFSKAPHWWWKIHPVTAGDELEITNFIQKNRHVMGDDGKLHYQPPSSMEIAHMEIALLFDGTNIPEEKDKPVEDGGKPLLEVGDSIDKILDVLRHMPQSMIMEIWEAIAKANPDGRWGPQLPKEEDES